MPLVFSTTAHVSKMKTAATLAYSLIEGYTFNAVYKAVGKRQGKQKYITQHLRALRYLDTYPTDTNVEFRILNCYSRNNWAVTDVKKVYTHFYKKQRLSLAKN